MPSLRTPRLRIFLLLVLVGALLGAGGCSVGDYLSAYFNTYYNAQRLFEEAEKETINQRSTAQKEDPLLIPYGPSSTAKTKFASVIEKCSKLLQYHPTSSLVDNALLMIARSYLYQNEYQKAERKFKELLDSYPQSSFALTARQLLAETYYRMGDREAARKLVRETRTLATERGDETILYEIALVSARMNDDEKNYEAARNDYEQAAQHAPGSVEQSGAYRKMAETESLRNRPAEAADAYRKSYSASADYASAYKARIGLVRMLSRLGKYDAAFDILDDLRTNQNNKEFFGEIDVAYGNVHRDAGDPDAAIAQYTYVDTTYARTESQAQALLERGLLYENTLHEYDSAAVSYAKGRSAYPQADVTPDLVRRSDYLNRYIRLRRDIASLDSIRMAILAPPPSLPDSVADSTSVAGLPDSLTLAHRDTLRSAPRTPAMPLDTVNAKLALAKTELAGLFYTAMGVTDSAQYWYERLLADHPASAFVPRALFTLAQIYNQDSSGAPHRGDSLYHEVVDRYPESEFASEARRLLGLPPVAVAKDPAEQLYGRAERLMRSGDRGAAIDTFRAVVEKFPESSFASRAQYAVGFLYEQQGAHPDSAVANYQRLVQLYPRSEGAGRIKPVLDAIENARRAEATPPAPDSLTSAPPAGKEPAVDREAEIQKLRDLRRNAHPSTPNPQSEEPPKEKPKPL